MNYLKNLVNYYNPLSGNMTEQELVDHVLSLPYTIHPRFIKTDISMSNIITFDYPTVFLPESITDEEKHKYYRNYYAIHIEKNEYLQMLRNYKEYDTYYGDLFIFSSNTEMYKRLYKLLPHKEKLYFKSDDNKWVLFNDNASSDNWYLTIKRWHPDGNYQVLIGDINNVPVPIVDSTTSCYLIGLEPNPDIDKVYLNI